MHVIVNKDHRESSWNSVGAFLDDFRTINLDLGPKSRFSAPGPTVGGSQPTLRGVNDWGREQPRSQIMGF